MTKLKPFFKSILEDVNYPYKKYFDYFMILLIVVSIVILVLSKSEQVPSWLVTFDLYFITSIFAIEYLLRLWVRDESVSKTKHFFSLPALIDLVAIFPKFRILRLLKLYHYMHSVSSMFDALVKKRFEFIFLGYMLFGVTFTLGSIFYLLEFGKNENITSYLDAIYWALVTVSTVGYGDISPVTEIGKIVSMFGIVIGVAMISFVTSIMVSAFSERFNELRNQDSINYIKKMDNIVVINGYGQLGSTVAKKLNQSNIYEAVIIEPNIEEAKKAREDGYRVIVADGSSAKLITTMYKSGNVAAMLTLTSSDIDNIYFILNAKSLNKDIKVYTRVNDPMLINQYNATKVDGVIDSSSVIDSQAIQYIKDRMSSNSCKTISIFGYTHKSRTICKALSEENYNINIFENDKRRETIAVNDGFKNIVMLENNHNVSVDDNSLALCAMNDDSVNVYYAITFRANGFKNEIIALSDSKEDNRKLLLAGVDKIFDMYEESAIEFVDMIKKGSS